MCAFFFLHVSWVMRVALARRLVRLVVPSPRRAINVVRFLWCEETAPRDYLRRSLPARGSLRGILMFITPRPPCLNVPLLRLSLVLPQLLQHLPSRTTPPPATTVVT